MRDHKWSKINKLIARQQFVGQTGKLEINTLSTYEFRHVRSLESSDPRPVGDLVVVEPVQ